MIRYRVTKSGKLEMLRDTDKNPKFREVVCVHAQDKDTTIINQGLMPCGEHCHFFGEIKESSIQFGANTVSQSRSLELCHRKIIVTESRVTGDFREYERKETEIEISLNKSLYYEHPRRTIGYEK